MNQIEASGEKICSRQEILDGQMKGRTNGQTDHYRAPGEQGPNQKAVWDSEVLMQMSTGSDEATRIFTFSFSAKMRY